MMRLGKQNVRQSNREGGFTMIELLVAIVVFGLLTTSVVYFLSQQNTLSTRATDAQKSLNVAKLALDSLKISPYDSLRAGQDTLESRYIRSWHITVIKNSLSQPTGSKQVDLSVYWPISATNSVSLSTLVSSDAYKEQSSP